MVSSLIFWGVNPPPRRNVWFYNGWESPYHVSWLVPLVGLFGMKSYSDPPLLEELILFRSCFVPSFVVSADQKVCAEDYGCTLAMCEVFFV